MTFADAAAAQRALSASDDDLLFYNRVLRVHPAHEEQHRKSLRELKAPSST